MGPRPVRLHGGDRWRAACGGGAGGINLGLGSPPSVVEVGASSGKRGWR
uniref:Uncharacterized protein n=1 Tax=Arundo donax TaxID=35708 RepID=A0A0A9AIN6_ARUDO